MNRTRRADLLAITILACLCVQPLVRDVAAEDKSKDTVLTTLSPFGIGSCHACNWGAPANAGWIPQMVEIGITNHRCPNTGWSAVEPKEGKRTWDALDKQMTYLESQKIAFGGILAGNPEWSADAKRGLPINNIAGWKNYVTEVVKHCKGRIKYWEVWNEPPNGTGKNQTAADYAKIVIAAYDAVKAADPECLVGIAAQSVNINYLDQAIKAGAKGHFDYVTLHPYEVAGCTIKHPGTEMVYLQIKGTLRKMLAVRDPDKVNCPVIFTELGHAAGGQYAARLPGFSDADVQAHAVVKYYAMGIAQGVDCIQWFEGMDGDSGPMGLLDGKAKPRPAYTAMAQMIVLRAASQISGLATPERETLRLRLPGCQGHGPGHLGIEHGGRQDRLRGIRANRGPVDRQSHRGSHA